jgi:GMP synthase-like glutamine amidotransferase
LVGHDELLRRESTEDEGARHTDREAGGGGPRVIPEPDRVVEALRWTGGSYVFGVQWHPEFHTDGAPSFIDDTPILDDFLARASH